MGGIVSTRDGQHADTQSDSTPASSQRAGADGRDGGALANADMVAKPAAPTEPMTLAQRVREAFGLEDRPDRPGLIPLVPTEEGLIASQWLYDLAKAIVLPKHVMSGGSWTPEDVTDSALAIGAGGLAAGGGPGWRGTRRKRPPTMRTGLHREAPGCIIHPRSRSALSRRITPREPRPMTQETSPTTSTETPSKSADELWAEEWWAEMAKPSRQRNLTPSERLLLAENLRVSRELRAVERGATPKRKIAVLY